MEYITAALSFLATALLAVLGLLWRGQEKKIDKMEEEKQGKELCDERHKGSDEKFGVLFTKFDKMNGKMDENKKELNGKIDDLMQVLMDIKQGVHANG